MRFGYWLPVFGGWLRNVPDEGMAATWDYVSRLAQRSEQLGFDVTLIAELNLNDIKGPDAPSLDAWTTTALFSRRVALRSIAVGRHRSRHRTSGLQRSQETLTNARMRSDGALGWDTSNSRQAAMIGMHRTH